jgi:hypothetical protein
MPTTATEILLYSLLTIDELVGQLGFYDRMLEGEWFDAWLFVWSTRIGRSGFAMLIGGAFVVGLWTWTESITPPATFLTLTVGVSLAQWPGPAASLGLGLIVAALSIGLFSIARKRL